MKRFFYALRLHGWFYWRKHKRKEPFSWFLQQYDIREATFKGDSE